MKFTTCLFTFLSLILVVSALPSPVQLDENAIEARTSAMGTSYSLAARDEQWVREDEPIFERYFGQELDLTEREWAEGTVEPRQYAQAAKLVIKGVIKLVELIKGRIQQDKDVRSSFNLYIRQ